MPGSFFNLDLHCGFCVAISYVSTVGYRLMYTFCELPLFALFGRAGLLNPVPEAHWRPLRLRDWENISDAVESPQICRLQGFTIANVACTKDMMLSANFGRNERRAQPRFREPLFFPNKLQAAIITKAEIYPKHVFL